MVVHKFVEACRQHTVVVAQEQEQAVQKVGQLFVLLLHEEQKGVMGCFIVFALVRNDFVGLDNTLKSNKKILEILLHLVVHLA